MPTFKPELTIAVQVSDWLAARDWYRDVLGLEETFVVEEGGWAEFAGPLGVVIGLSDLHGQAHPGVGGTTITFGVSDIEAARAESDRRPAHALSLIHISEPTRPY